MRAPLNNPDNDAFFDRELTLHELAGMRMKKDLANFIFNDLVDKEKGVVVAPDTTGVDYFFLRYFITDPLEADFPVILQDFMDKCRDRLNEFNEVGWYREEQSRTIRPLDGMYNRIMRLMYNGAKIGDEYCVELIKNLYKVYYKKEYNQLKRFTSIGPDEIFSLTESEYDDIKVADIGRVMGMCPFMGIKFQDSCSFLFKYLESRRDSWIEDEEEESEFVEFPPGVFEEAQAQVEQWYAEDEKKNLPYDKLRRKYWDLGEFVGACLKHRGYSEDYAFFCIENNMGLKIQMTRTLALLKTIHPGREYIYEQVQELTNIYDLVAALTDVAEHFEYEVGYLLGDKVDEIDIEDAWFNPANMSYKKAAPKKNEKKPITNVAPVSNGEIAEDDYLEEIAELRSRLHEKEQENKYLRDQFRAVKRSAEETDGMLKKYEEDRDELIALREFVYNSEHDEEDAVQEDKLPEMKAYIADKNVVIIGGHVNWQNKLKEMFPDWKYVSLTSFKTVDGSMLENKDKVYFYTDYISHTSYYKFIAAVRERKIPFGYIGSYNLDKVVRQIYKDLKG